MSLGLSDTVTKWSCSGRKMKESGWVSYCTRPDPSSVSSKGQSTTTRIWPVSSSWSMWEVSSSSQASRMNSSTMPRSRVRNARSWSRGSSTSTQQPGTRPETSSIRPSLDL